MRTHFLLCLSQLPYSLHEYIHYHGLFVFVLFGSLSFPHFQTALQTLELFLFMLSLAFLWHLWQVYSLYLSLHLCSSSRQPLYCLLLYFLVLGCLIEDATSLIVSQHLLESSSVIIHQSLCERGSRVAARVVAKAEATDC